MWEKRGLIYNVKSNHDWNKSHAQVPVIDILSDRLRIYYSTRDERGKSNISYVEVEKNDPGKLLYECPKPLFNLGNIGSFDDSGIMPSSIINVREKKYLYYIGWTTRQTVPYQNAIGLAISEDGGKTFRKFSEGPIISINHIEPYFSGTSFVLLENNLFRMWYLSCFKWEIINNRPEPFYHIKYAESVDGINWEQTGKVAIELNKDEGGLASASVIKENDVYKMWYSKRKKADFRLNVDNTYRIGYAESLNGINWSRKDKLAGINVSEKGWDAEMLAYPYVINLEGRKLMFYNGNGFGRSGFGYAIWKNLSNSK